MSNVMNIHPMEIELFHADGQTGRHAEAFHNFANAPKNHMYIWALHVAIS
jgi:hypothetical protein